MPHYFRKVFIIRAVDSPNVRLALAEQQVGREPSGRIVVDGILPWGDYKKRLATWDPIRVSIGLNATFWEGKDTLMYPPQWLDKAEETARGLDRLRRQAKAIGCDPAEGGDSSTWAIVDELGLLDLITMKTPDTSVITARTSALMRQWNVPAERVVFDRGGGGKEHADRLRLNGHDVRSVGFGEAPHLEPKRGTILLEERKDSREEHYAYKNLRAQMYGELRLMLEPGRVDTRGNPLRPFGLPDKFPELRRQLALMPLLYDDEGRMYMLSKGQRGEKQLGGNGPTKKQRTLIDLIGHSPDESDALVLAVFSMLHAGPVQATAGATW